MELCFLFVLTGSGIWGRVFCAVRRLRQSLGSLLLLRTSGSVKSRKLGGNAAWLPGEASVQYESKGTVQGDSESAQIKLMSLPSFAGRVTQWGNSHPQ